MQYNSIRPLNLKTVYLLKSYKSLNKRYLKPMLFRLELSGDIQILWD